MNPIHQDHIDSNEPATKGDLENLREDLQLDITNSITASEIRVIGTLRGEMKEMGTTLRQEMTAMKDEILRHFDVAVENIHKDVAGANKDEIEMIKDHVFRIEEHLDLEPKIESSLKQS